MDRCFPSIVLHTNKWRGTTHYTYIGFFLIATSLVLILGTPLTHPPTCVLQ